MTTDSSKPTAGFDFGTSTTLIATRHRGESAEVLPIGETTPWLPSVVGVSAEDLLVVGERAEALPRRDVVRSIKSAITRGDDTAMLPSGRQVNVQQAVLAVFEEAIGRASVQGVDLRKVGKVQLGCPAIWGSGERDLLVSIAEKCELEIDISDVVDEPIAAGIAWIEDRWTRARFPDSKVLVFDPGGGTLDVALLQVKERDGLPEVNVLSADGVAEAGDVLDRTIADDLREKLGPSLDDAGPPAVVEALLLDRARELKEMLTDEQSASRPLGGGSTLLLPYDRPSLEKVFEEQCMRALSLVDSVMRAGKLRERQGLSTTKIRALSAFEVANGIDYVVLVGGMSQIPMIKTRLQSLLPKAEVTLVSYPQNAVARGLAYAEDYERLNLHRPGFDIWVTFSDGLGRQCGQPQLVYPAFTALYNRRDLVLQDRNIGYSSPQRLTPPAGSVDALLNCKTVDGRPLPLLLGKETLKGIPLTVSERHMVTFKLYVDGRIVFGYGNQGELRIKSWPTLRGPHHNWVLELEGDPHAILGHRDLDEWRFIH